MNTPNQPVTTAPQWTAGQLATAYLICHTALEGCYWEPETLDWAEERMRREKRVGAQLVHEALTEHQHIATLAEENEHFREQKGALRVALGCLYAAVEDSIKGEACDHSVGVCYCELHAKMDLAKKIMDRTSARPSTHPQEANEGRQG